MLRSTTGHFNIFVSGIGAIQPWIHQAHPTGMREKIVNHYKIMKGCRREPFHTQFAMHANEPPPLFSPVGAIGGPPICATSICLKYRRISRIFFQKMRENGGFQPIRQRHHTYETVKS